MNPPAEPSTYDLHLHTWWSYDATAEVESHFAEACKLRLRCIAITEHHLMDSLPAALKTADSYPEVRAIPAAELSVNTSVGGVDLLCYGLPEATGGTPLAPVLDRYRQWQQEAGAAVSIGLCRLGFPYDDEARLRLLRTYRRDEAIARQGVTHVNNNVQRAFFVEKGWINGEEEYRKLMARVTEEASVPPYPPVEEVTHAVRASGGLVAIAHPHNYFLGVDKKRMDRLREECALDGIECAHPNVDPALTPLYRDYCIRHGLFSVAGSDSHSEEDIRARMGRHGGDPLWLDEFLERLDSR